MSAALSLAGTAKQSGKLLRRVETVAPWGATGLVASVYEQVAREFAIVPPITIHSAVPEILAGLWCLTREAFIVGRAARARREMVAAGISRTNSCPYCVEVHSAMLHATRDHDLARKLSSDAEAAEAARTEPLIRWALSTREPHAPTLANPPFSAREAPQILGTAAAFHFINRMVNIFLEASPVPALMRAPALKPLIGRFIGATLGKRMAGVDAKPGLSLALLPDAALPEQFRWAEPESAVAGAIARMASAIERHGSACLPEAAMETVRARVAAAAKSAGGPAKPASLKGEHKDKASKHPADKSANEASPKGEHKDDASKHPADKSANAASKPGTNANAPKGKGASGHPASPPLAKKRPEDGKKRPDNK